MKSALVVNYSLLIVILAFLLLCATGSSHSQRQSFLTASFQVRCSNCCIAHTFKLSVRYKINQSSDFNPWYLAYSDNGYCNDGKRQNISLPVDNVSQVQYRLEMPAQTAERCNIVMDDRVYLYLNNNEMNVSTSFLFCNHVSATNTDEPVIIETQILALSTTTNLFIIDSSSCDNDSSLLFASQISPDIICPINVLDCQIDNDNILLTLSFLLTLRYPCHCDCVCQALDSADEGILLSKNSMNTLTSLHFYTDSCNGMSSSHLKISKCIFPDACMLEYDGQNISCTVSKKEGPHFYSLTLNVTKGESISFIWKQYFTAQSLYCDIWALDDVAVSIEYLGQSRVIYNETFNNPSGWIFYNGRESDDSIECDNRNGKCLFFSDGQGEANRTATSPLFDVNLVEIVTLPSVFSSNVLCDANDETLIHISFLFQLHNFTQPLPITDSFPNTILLSLSTDQYEAPLAYYAPVGNKYWTDFNTTTLYHVPIYSPNSTHKTELSFCISKNVDSFYLMWEQDNYTVGADIWSLGQFSVLSKQRFNEPLWDHANGNIMHPGCSSSSDNSSAFFLMNEGNASASRFVRMLIQRSVIQPTSSLSGILPSSTPLPLFCESNGTWPKTSANQNVSGFCHNGIINANRFCNRDGVWEEIICHTSEDFNRISQEIKQDPNLALSILNETREAFSSREAVVLLNMIVTSVENVTEEHTEQVIGISESIIRMKNISNNKEQRRIAGTRLLLILDELALKLDSNNSVILSETIKMKSRKIIKADRVVGISFDGNSITLPPEIFSTLPVRVASYILQDLSSVLEPNSSSLQLISDVVSATTDCKGCNFVNLSESVNITFNLSSSPQVEIRNLICAYWKIRNSSDNSSVTGEWDTNGCNTSNKDGSILECNCDHLTHFAILLSPDSSSSVNGSNLVILTTIGQVFVTISLVCMLLTILCYSCMRKLWSIRNYIHIMLCINLFIAQLTFLFGVQRIENKVACSIIATVMQYMFLVTFMWMLMEGAILYIALVKVFTTRTRHYAVAFTLVCYSVPAIYMMLVVPIGYLVDTGNNQSNHYLLYNNDELVACWLSYETGFIWSFIAPVILIILINIGFFIMAIVIMKRHKKAQPNQSFYNDIKYWIKCSMSLTCVMGIAWLGSVLFFREELLFIAYIMTVLIAGQGIVIFVLYVPLSKHVRAAYSKWWNDKKANSEIIGSLSLRASNLLRPFSFQQTSVSVAIKADQYLPKHCENVIIGTSKDSSDTLNKARLDQILNESGMKDESFIIANEIDDDYLTVTDS
ncbi:PREDICTED: uncharacterized protein LOC100635907 isoform X1 [Amphimedon queenslandica]|uniref:G-protein coupled receptors family 2 profile 2 domain-containing protein n=1 Tax=Amphimedon queenslandica TaxID=400682 RepID=A0AAN0JCU1_AMPQE|nr:PREDICTED: uncharacterized protein LOC100635907 isoform X1 [Amphimedon queenslandica]|eukprot:XP_019854597.1 PREDICTED: uncharacterized protein LOC100635907 isoform X1 [Amphimedon queenslandica]